MKLFQLAEPFETLEGLYAAWLSKYSDIPELVDNILTKSWNKDALVASEFLLQKHEVDAILSTDSCSPSLLAQNSDPRYVFYYHGDILRNRCLSCVGTRGMSLYGKRAIATLIPGLSSLPVCIVSVLALGVDVFLHQVALENNIATAAGLYYVV